VEHRIHPHVVLPLDRFVRLTRSLRKSLIISLDRISLVNDLTNRHISTTIVVVHASRGSMSQMRDIDDNNGSRLVALKGK
jgi:hypothetical protein